MKDQMTDKLVGAKSKLLYRYITSRALKYYDVHSLPLIRYEIWNNTLEPISFFVETMIAGYTFGVEHLEEVQAQSSIYHYHLPISDLRRMASLTGDSPTAVYARVYNGTKKEDPCLTNETYEFTLLAYDKICLAVPHPGKEGAYKPLFKHLDAWIEEGKGDAETILGEAAQIAGGRLVGYEGKKIDPEIPRSQIKAIYQAVRERGLNYVPGDFNLEGKDRGVIQKLRPPSVCLGHAANCIEGAVLFACLIEGADLDAVIVLRPGHAFIGWRQWKGEESCEFLDTTSIGNGASGLDFEKAYERGMEEYRALRRERPGKEPLGVTWSNDETFDINDYAYLLDIKRNHKEISEDERDTSPYYTEDLTGPVEPSTLHNGTQQPLETAKKPVDRDKTPLTVAPSLCGSGQHHAVLVGVNDYSALAHGGLCVCANDAAMLYEQLLVSSFYPSHLHLLTDETFTLPTSENIDASLSSMVRDSRLDDLLLFYYSGSVLKEGQSYYLVTYETQCSELQTTALALERVKQILEGASAGAKVVILDIHSVDAQEEKDIKTCMQHILERLTGLTVLAFYKEKRGRQRSSIFTPLLVEHLKLQADHTAKGYFTVLDVYHNLLSYGDTQYSPYLSQLESANSTILCFPSRERRQYVLDAYRYMVNMQKSLEDVQMILTRREMVAEADCNHAIDVLNKPEVPEIHPSEDSLKVLDKVYSLDLQVRQLKGRELERLREDCRHRSKETQQECQSC